MQTLAQIKVGGTIDEKQATVRQWVTEARVFGQECGYAGKRRHPRITWQAPLTVQILDGARVGESEYGAARDISEGGVGLRVRRSVPVWSHVRVTYDGDGRQVYGQVMHCTETVGGFIVGVQFQSQQENERTIRRSA